MALAGQAVDGSNISNLRDILQTYNKITEVCFNQCVASLGSKDLSSREEDCVNACSGKMISTNQRMMSIFMELQAKKQQAVMEEMQAQANAQAQPPGGAQGQAPS